MGSANTLTNLIDPIHEAFDIVARERTGSLNAVTLSAKADQAALNQPIRAHIAPAASTSNITPGAYAPDDGGETVGYVDLNITKLQRTSFEWTGEEQLSVGDRFNPILVDQITQRIRAFANAMSADVATAVKTAASRAYGTAGTTPFNTANDLSDIAAMNRILDDNGAPSSDRNYVGNGAVFQNLRAKQGILIKVNESGSDTMLRTGQVLPLEGFNLWQDKFVPAPVTVGTGSSYVLNGTHAAGLTTVTVKTGSGTILAGDVVTITSGGVANSYVVATALSAGSFTINTPGLQVAGADGDTVTVVATHTKNFALHKSAIVLAARLPALPSGDNATDAVTVVDPNTGIAYRFAHYAGYMQNHYELQAAWGVKVVKPDYLAINLG